MTTIQRKGRKGRKVIGPAFVVIALAAFAIQFVDAHKAITSKYTYNDDVFPIFRERCAKCHVPGGVAPMSLMTYDDAFPWAESIRAELVAAHMPPWNADEAFGDLKHAHTLSAKELDVILTWATGGNPRGALDQKLPAVALKNDWPMGKPDLALPIPSEFAFAADKMEDTQEFTVATGVTEPRWVRAVEYAADGRMNVYLSGDRATGLVLRYSGEEARQAWEVLTNSGMVVPKPEGGGT